ncbi:MAG: phosphodiester glycosidase family protein [Lachnospiraceae bacterium]
MIILFWKKYRWAIFYSIFLVSFTVYIALDTFVITRVYTTVSSLENTSNETINDKTATESENISSDGNETKTKSQRSNKFGMGKDSNNFSDDTTDSETIQNILDFDSLKETSYRDDNIEITITKHQEYDTDIYVANITLSSAKYLKTAFAQDAYGKNITEKTSEIAARNNAILAINGDFYGTQESGYVIRNGILYRNTAIKGQEDLVIYEDGSFEIIKEEEISAEELLKKGAIQTLAFGPALVTNSSIAVSENEEVGKAKASNPRTAIGIIDELHYVFVVSDGRTSDSEGLSLYELAQFMKSQKVKTAYNLDGGGSSTMYFNGNVINKPTTSGRSIKERSVSDIVFISK